MEEINFHEDSMLTGHGSLQNADVERLGRYCLRIISILSLEGGRLKDVIAIAYVNFFSIAGNAGDGLRKENSTVVV